MSNLLFPLLALAVVSPVDSKSNGDDTVIIIVLEDSKPATKTNRSSSLCPVECRYFTLTDMLELSFLSNLGHVLVTLDDMTAGETTTYSGNSASGMMVVPVAPSTCYTMSIVTDSGRTFRASFVTAGSADDNI